MSLSRLRQIAEELIALPARADGLIMKTLEARAEELTALADSVFDIDEALEYTDAVSIYPDAGKGTIAALSYAALGLAGEAGEVADKTKKVLRDGDTPERRGAIAPELGDAFFYFVRACRELGLRPSDVVRANRAKLLDRQRRGVLSGSGDNR